MYAVTSTWLVSFTRATLRRAEFGFFGVVVYTRVHTPRRCGLPLRAGVLVLAVFSWRPFRTSCWIVGTESPSSLRFLVLLCLLAAPERVFLLFRTMRRGWPAVFVSIPTPVVGRVADPRSDQAQASLRLLGEKLQWSGLSGSHPFGRRAEGSKPSYRLTHARTRLLTGTNTQVTEPRPRWSKQSPARGYLCLRQSTQHCGSRVHFPSAVGI